MWLNAQRPSGGNGKEKTHEWGFLCLLLQDFIPQWMRQLLGEEGYEFPLKGVEGKQWSHSVCV